MSDAGYCGGKVGKGLGVLEAVMILSGVIRKGMDTVAQEKKVVHSVWSGGSEKAPQNAFFCAKP